jgi:Protein of unknown function (DUF2892)
MTVNVGSVDRAFRILIGLGLIAWALGYLPNVGASAWGWVGLVPLLTGVFGYCPVYTLISMNTCKRA